MRTLFRERLLQQGLLETHFIFIDHCLKEKKEKMFVYANKYMPAYLIKPIIFWY